MLKFVSRNILTGLVTILPIALTLYLLYWVVVSTEAALGFVLRSILPDMLYRPGVGVVTALLLAFLVGLLMNAYLVRQLFIKSEEVLYRMPLVNSVYRAIRDFFQYFSPDKKKEFEQVVSVSIGDTGMRLIGFVTQVEKETLPGGFREEESILVYLPLSYMIGGYAVLVPRSRVQPVDMSLEEAMRFTLTAGVTGKYHAPSPGPKG